MNPAEEIVKYWLQEQGYFVQSSIACGQNKEIDILAIHSSRPNDRKHVEVSVSVGMLDPKHTSQTKAYEYRDRKFEHPRVQKKIEERFNNGAYSKELVVGEIKLEKKENLAAFTEECDRLGITVIPFSRILEDVYASLGTASQLNAVIKAIQLVKKFS